MTPPMEPIPVPMLPADQIGMDIQELQRSVNGNRYTVLFIDYASKYPVMVPIPDRKAETVARAMVDHWISVFGPPKVIISDRGAEIIGKVMAEVCQIFDIKQQTTTAHHPQSDGLAERFHRTIQAMLSKTLNGKNLDRWDEFLQPLLMGYRATPNSTTKLPPMEIMMGRAMRLPTDSELAREVSVYTAADTEEYVNELRKGLNVIWQVKQDNISAEQNRQKASYDKDHKAKETTLVEGDIVYINNPSLKRGPAYKLKFEWEGPYEVTSLTGTNAYVKKCGRAGADTKCVHISKVSKVRPFTTDVQPAAVEQADVYDTEQDIPSPMPEPQPKRGRGRPRKMVTTAVPGRGGDDQVETQVKQRESEPSDMWAPYKGTRYFRSRVNVVGAVYPVRKGDKVSSGSSLTRSDSNADYSGSTGAQNAGQLKVTSPQRADDVKNARGDASKAPPMDNTRSGATDQGHASPPGKHEHATPLRTTCVQAAKSQEDDDTKRFEATESHSAKPSRHKR